MKTPSRYQHIETSQSLGEAFLNLASTIPSTTLLRYPTASSADAVRIWHTVSYSEATKGIARIAHYLKELGVGVGTPVAIVSNTRIEWMLTDMAIQMLGGITVSIYQSLPPSEIGFILHDSGARIVCIENQEQFDKLSWLQSNHCHIPARESVPEDSVLIQVDHTLSFEPITSAPEISTISSLITDNALSPIPPAIPTELSRSSTSSYVYTSGTTGPPKGVIQSHGNHLCNVFQAATCGVFGGDVELFLYLPLAHSFARLIYHAGFITSTSLALPAVIDHKTSKLDLSSVARDLREANPEVLPSVPRLFEKMASAIKAKAGGAGLQSLILKYCLKNAAIVQKATEGGKNVFFHNRVAYTIFKPIRRKILHQLFGNRFRHAISGGARLDPTVTRFFDGLGAVICEGYGLTETAVATHVNVPDTRRIGSVGRSFPQVEVSISKDDGEIVIRGPNVAHGYLNRPAATESAWSSDGWFRTGDVGHVDDDGFLYITDRKKELVITAGGKKIPPSAIEGLFKGSSFISHAFFYGEGKPYCVALLTLNEVEIRATLQNRNALIDSEAPLHTNSFVVSEIDRIVQEVNRNLASYESIKKFYILDEDFTIENGLLTPTLKMKRKMIVERYAVQLESLYDKEATPNKP